MVTQEVQGQARTVKQLLSVKDAVDFRAAFDEPQKLWLSKAEQC